MTKLLLSTSVTISLETNGDKTFKILLKGEGLILVYKVHPDFKAWRMSKNRRQLVMSYQQLGRRGQEVEPGYKTLRPLPYPLWPTLSMNAPPTKDNTTPKQRHLLGAKCSKTVACGGSSHSNHCR